MKYYSLVSSVSAHDDFISTFKTRFLALVLISLKCGYLFTISWLNQKWNHTNSLYFNLRICEAEVILFIQADFLIL